MRYRFKIDKLIRDKTVERAAQAGVVVDTRILAEDEYKKELVRKLVEEAHEVAETISQEERVSEMADVFDVYQSILVAFNISQQEVEAVRSKKLQERGGFTKKLYSSHADVIENDTPRNKWYLEYYLNNAHKYPLIEKSNS